MKGHHGGRKSEIAIPEKHSLMNATCFSPSFGSSDPEGVSLSEAAAVTLVFEGSRPEVKLQKQEVARRGFRENHRCPFWLIWLKNRGRFLVYLVVQSTTRTPHLFSTKKDTYGEKPPFFWPVAGPCGFCNFDHVGYAAPSFEGEQEERVSIFLTCAETNVLFPCWL